MPSAFQRLLYIGSTGYSGSTLLESILGTNDQCVNIGEICKLASWTLCTCDQHTYECPFWIDVLERLKKRSGNPQTQLKEWHIQRGRAAKAVLPFNLHDLFITAGGPGTLPLARLLSKEIADFNAGCKRALELFEVIAEGSKASVIVDSSKDPVLLKHFYAEDPSRFKVIHLVRDPIATCYSFFKNFARDGVTYPSEKTGRAPTIEETARFWVNRNRKIELSYYTVPKHQRLLLKYEDLCLKPEETARKLSDFVGLEISIPEEIALKQQHAISGNPMRLSQNVIRVKLNEDWESKLSPKDRATIHQITATLARKYGYP
ncbi:MAG: sulfotransferase [Verrucomicrobiaceae bacterium]|nr:sulfotransferase [Verrucomicrobiaceae bacterium]